MLSTNIETPLISATELAEILNEPHVKVFDVRGRWGQNNQDAYSEYLDEHIEGAHFLDWLQYFVEADVPINQASVAGKEKAQADFSALGINQNDLVVVYDDYHHMLAGRVWWAMSYWGFQNVKLLNGGFSYWKANHLPMSTSVKTLGRGTFLVSEQPEYRVTTNEVSQRSEDVLLVDARGKAGFDGKITDPESGHIPGAINIPFLSLIDKETGLFKSHDEINSIIKESIDDIEHKIIISSCGSGYSGTIFLIALKLIGINSPLYDGSISEWKMMKNPLVQTK